MTDMFLVLWDGFDGKGYKMKTEIFGIFDSIEIARQKAIENQNSHCRLNGITHRYFYQKLELNRRSFSQDVHSLIEFKGERLI